MIYLDLFIGFLKVGLFAFGGAYAAIPLIRDVVLSYGWISDEMLSYMIAVSESTPGPIMINLATYVGANQGGILGALLATFAVVLPSFIIIVLVTKVLEKFLKNKYFNAVLSGLKPCIIGIILAVGITFTLENLMPVNSKFDFMALVITLILALIYWGSRKVNLKHLKSRKVNLKGKNAGEKKAPSKGISPIVLILIAGAMGIIFYGLF